MSCTHKTGNNCDQSPGWWDAQFGYPHKRHNQYYYGYKNGGCEDIGMPSLAPGVMGVGTAMDTTVQQCANAAKEKLYSSDNLSALQALYDQGYTDEQIFDALYAECEKQLNGEEGKKTDSKTDTMLPEKVNTYGAIGFAVGSLVFGGIVGYFIGRS